jgi:hypothetical protein
MTLSISGAVRQSFTAGQIFSRESLKKKNPSENGSCVCSSSKKKELALHLGQGT